MLTSAALVIGGCRSTPDQRAPPAVATASGAEASAATRGGFTLSASMLDTWNAVGQLLVRQPGVTYEGRAQMLGLYSVRYRDQQFLILTRARVIEVAGDGMRTQVIAVWPDGKPNGTHAAVELLGLLQRQLPAELLRIAALGK